jgi:hypothetical protein
MGMRCLLAKSDKGNNKRVYNQKTGRDSVDARDFFDLPPKLAFVSSFFYFSLLIGVSVTEGIGYVGKGAWIFSIGIVLMTASLLFFLKKPQRFC